MKIQGAKKISLSCKLFWVAAAAAMVGTQFGYARASGGETEPAFLRYANFDPASGLDYAIDQAPQLRGKFLLEMKVFDGPARVTKQSITLEHNPDDDNGYPEYYRNLKTEVEAGQIELILWSPEGKEISRVKQTLLLDNSQETELTEAGAGLVDLRGEFHVQNRIDFNLISEAGREVWASFYPRITLQGRVASGAMSLGSPAGAEFKVMRYFAGFKDQPQISNGAVFLRETREAPVDDVIIDE